MFFRDKFRLFYQSEYKKGNLKEVQRSVEKVILFCTNKIAPNASEDTNGRLCLL